MTPFTIIGRLVHLHKKLGQQTDQQRLVQLGDAINWTTDEFDELKLQLQALADLTGEIGNPKAHAFRSVQCGMQLRSDTEQLKLVIKDCSDSVQKLLELGKRLARLLKISIKEEELGLKEIGNLTAIANCLAHAPKMDRNAIANDCWETDPKSINSAIDLGQQFSQSMQRLDGKLNEGVLDIPVEETRRHLNAYGRQFFLFRIFNKKYRLAKNTLQEILRDVPPVNVDEQIAILDDMLNCRKFQESLLRDTRLTEMCRSAFGDQWKEDASDWNVLREIVTWVQEGIRNGIHKKFRLIHSMINVESSVIEHYVDEAETIVPRYQKLLIQACDLLQLDVKDRFLTNESTDLPLQQIDQWLSHILAAFESLPDWIRYRLKRDQLTNEGLGPIVTLLDAGEVASESAVDFFEFKYQEQLFRSVHAEHPEIAEFSGTTHEAVRQRFQEADHEMIETTRDEVANSHLANIPGGNLGGMGTIRHEIQKKSRHKAIRRLIKEAGPAVQRIKPVFMMSPLSVAQYLEPGAVEFDLLLIDEASQIEPVDALCRRQ